MALTIFIVMVVLLLLGFPMMVPLIAGALIGVIELFGDLGKTEFIIQQMLGGIRPSSLIAVPMFILAADIMTKGQSANRLIDMVMAFIRHIRGALRSVRLRRVHCLARFPAQPRLLWLLLVRPCGHVC